MLCVRSDTWGWKVNFPSAVGHRIFDLEERVLFAFVGLNGKVECVVALGADRIELDAGGQAGGPLRRDAGNGGFGWKCDFERARRPLGARWGAGVVDEVALGDVQLAIVGFELVDVGLDEDAVDLGGHIVDGNVAGAAALGRGDEVAGALVGDANQVGTAAWLIEGVVPLGIGGGVRDFAHAGLHVDEDDGVARCRFVGGLVW